jgi:hypothetical protein
MGLAPLKYGRILTEQVRRISYHKLRGDGPTGFYRTRHIQQVPIDGTAWIEEDWTSAVIYPSESEYAKRLPSRYLPEPHGGRRSSDQKGHIIAHSLGGPDNKTENFFAQQASSNNKLYQQFERKVREKLSEPCVLFAAYFVQLHYVPAFQPHLPPTTIPLRPTGLSAFAFTFDVSRKPIDSVVLPYLPNP